MGLKTILLAATFALSLGCFGSLADDSSEPSTYPAPTEDFWEANSIAADKLRYFHNVDSSDPRTVLIELLLLVENGELIEFYEKTLWLNEYLSGSVNDAVLEDFARPINEQVFLGNQIFSMAQLVENVPILRAHLGPEWEYQYHKIFQRTLFLWNRERPASANLLTKVAVLTKVLIRIDSDVPGEQLAENLIQIIRAAECQISIGCLSAVYSNYEPIVSGPAETQAKQIDVNEALVSRYNDIANGYRSSDYFRVSLEVNTARANGL
jgi:hypothetical protein